MRAALCLVLGAASLGCAPSTVPPSPPLATTTPASTTSTAPVVPPPSMASAAPAVEAPAPEPAAPPVASVTLGTFTHELKEPIVSLALGEPRVGALGAEPWIFENGAFRLFALPEKLRLGPDDQGRIFFGRDDRARIMGTRVRDGKRSQLYLRWREGRWIAEQNEQAKLRDLPVEGLFGVLGHDDPEVLCKYGDDCIVKRRSGWKMLRAGTEGPRIEVHDGIAWALMADGVQRLEEDKRWVPVGAPAPYTKPGGVTAPGDEVWVSEPATGRVHHWRKGAWTSETAPVKEPRGLWSKGRDDVWLAGAEGLAHHDGKQWSRVEGPVGPLREVYGRGDEVWAAGAGGVWARRGAPR